MSKKPKAVNKVWTTIDDLGSTDDSDTTSNVLLRVEAMLKKNGLFDAYKEAINYAGGKSCSGGDKLKIAGYVYFGGSVKTNSRDVCVKKPMSLLRESEKVDEIREIGIKRWGDIKERPIRYIPICREEHKEWIGSIYPAPSKTLKKIKSFKDLSIDDRIAWAKHYYSKSNPGSEKDVAILRSMEYACKQMKIPVFVGKDRDPSLISALAQEYMDSLEWSTLLSSIVFLENSLPTSYLKHDCEVKKVKSLIKLLIPTLKSLDLLSEFKEYSVLVKNTYKPTSREQQRMDVEIAKFLICSTTLKEAYPVNVPDFLAKAIDGSVKPIPVSDKTIEDSRTTCRKDNIPNPPITSHRMGEKVNHRIDVQVDGKSVATIFHHYFDQSPSYYEDVESKARKVLSTIKGVNLKKVKKLIIVPDKMINFVGCK